MSEPAFLTLDEVLELHQEQIGRYGGSPGVRDIGLLQSALATPQASFGGQYLHATLPEMAAAYLFHLVKNHPFVDGNKRIGAHALVLFLVVNGHQPTFGSAELADVTLAVARGEVAVEALAIWIRQRTRIESGG